MITETKNYNNKYNTLGIKLLVVKKEQKKSLKIKDLKEKLSNNLKRFEKTIFFKSGIQTLLMFSIQNNSGKLLTNFISKNLPIIKKEHNFFFYFLKESLKQVISQKFSKVIGLKLIINGRINNAMRSKSKRIIINEISLNNISTKLDFSEAISFTKNGTLGIKLWLIKK
jgi:tRNA A-37 threonylcarbamoyl transferase component Bud32